MLRHRQHRGAEETLAAHVDSFFRDRIAHGIPERMREGIYGLGHFTLVHGEGGAAYYRRPIEVTDAGIERHRHKRHLVRAAHGACHIRAGYVRREHLAGGWKIFLHAHQHYRIVFARVFAGDVMQPRC